MITLFGHSIMEDNKRDIYTLAKEILHIEDEQMPLSAKADNEVVDLRYIPKDGEEIIPLYIDAEDGFRAYRQTIMLVFIVAAKKLYPDLKICLRRSINKSTYCEVVRGTIEEGYAEKIKALMCDIIGQNLYIEKTVLTIDEAVALYRQMGEEESAKTASVYEKETMNFYAIDDHKIYMRGQLTYKTGSVCKFDLSNFEHGMLLCYPNFRTGGELIAPLKSRRLVRVIDEYRIWGDTLGIRTVTDLNNAINSGQSNDLIHMQESFQDKRFVEIAQEIKVTFPRKRLILIAGPSSSSKTTFMKRLSIHLRINGLRPVNISLDDYYKPMSEIPLDEFGKPDLETVEAIDYGLFCKHLKELCEGREVTLPKFDFTIGKRVLGNTLKLSEQEVIIVEGIHALNEKISFSIRESDKYKIYITPLIDLQFDDANPVSPTDLRLIRRIVRDMQFRSTGGEGTLNMWDSVQRGELSYIFPFEESADVVFNSSFVYEFCVLKAFAWDELSSISRTSEKYSEAQRLLDVLSHFAYMNDQTIPSSSLLREFIGGSSF